MKTRSYIDQQMALIPPDRLPEVLKQTEAIIAISRLNRRSAQLVALGHEQAQRQPRPLGPQAAPPP